ncbi:WXG100 family type VII secretion target [Actinokineospora cianjurensis]|uniref:Uncharacterized protein YukE n=1 Tax=Actinokineospora cianjurensis TaxID=585224 RepID=A0A421B914_9PSEU|nr:type VII secretion target [Actinokineospora cianjurensis]RLK61022.1 uncharacterized protein YukE [Actinokineospora cianjurensis]
MDRFQVDSDRLALRAGQFDGLSSRVGGIHRELADQVSAAGACWGGDDIGLRFASTHAGSAHETLKALGALPGKLDDVGDRFRETARAYRHTDDHNAGVLDA